MHFQCDEQLKQERKYGKGKKIRNENLRAHHNSSWPNNVN